MHSSPGKTKAAIIPEAMGGKRPPAKCLDDYLRKMLIADA